MVQDKQPTESVFDFLYSDTRRIRSWYAQVFPDGVLLSHSKTSKTGEHKEDGISGNVNMSAGLDALVAKGAVTGEATASSQTGENLSRSHERNFDTSWSLELDLLNRLDELGMINRDISSSVLGSLVLISGHSKLIDVKLMQEMWDDGTNLAIADIKITHQNKSQIKQQKDTMKSIGGVFKRLPAVPQLYLMDESGTSFWSCLNEQNMIVSSSSLALMYGTIVVDEWHVLGILDAKPDDEEKMKSVEEVKKEYKQSQIAYFSSDILNVVRELMGRPKEAYGITPLLIFRKVK
ncbi:MAG: hypothetical protein NC211_03760 [Alistipes senegalensis]|nr:hypothetical protein [Oxalobacter formigenes]MCM1280934.1 hypothetical protein [Alistipes senegalensis]